MKSSLSATIAAALLASAGLIIACTTDSTTGDTSSSSSSSGAGTGDDAGKGSTDADVGSTAGEVRPTDSAVTNDGATGCNSVTNGASEATQSTIMSDPPAPTGGTIADGTYFLKSFEVYDPASAASGPDPSGLKTTMVIANNVMQTVQTLPDDSTDTFTESYVVSGTSLNRTLSCPKTGPDLEAVYSATGTTLIVFEKDATTGLFAASTYEKQ